MRRRTLVQAGATACLPLRALGQPAAPRQLGVLLNLPMPALAPPTDSATFAALLRGLQALGWREGENLIVHAMNSQAVAERYAVLAEAMLRLPLDAIVAAGPYAQSLQRMNTRVPVVMGGSEDPVGQGLARSLAQPGGLYTGLSNQLTELSRKRQEFLAELVPPPRKLGVLVGAAPRSSHVMPSLQLWAQALGREWVEVPAPDHIPLAQAFAEATRLGVGGLMVAGLLDKNAELNALAQRHRIALMFPLRQQRAGHEPADLISYAPDFSAIWYRAAHYVDRIFRGARPGDLPFEQPRQFELIINLRSARAIGLEVPASLLLRATRVIE